MIDLATQLSEAMNQMLFRLLLESDQAFKFARSLPERAGITLKEWIKDQIGVFEKLYKVERKLDNQSKLATTFKPVLTHLLQNLEDENPSPYREHKKRRYRSLKDSPRR